MTFQELENMTFSHKIEENLEILNEIFEKDEVFTARTAGKGYLIAYFDGMVDNSVVDLSILRPVANAEAGLAPEELMQRHIYTDNAEIEASLSTAVKKMIYGDTLIFCPGYDVCISASSKGYKMRGIDEPDAEKYNSGPHEGFSESLTTNTSLLRRRLMTPDAKFEMLTPAAYSGQRVCICYMDSVVDRAVLDKVKDRLKKLKMENITSMNRIVEGIEDKTFPFRSTGITERPDIAAAKIIEGRVVIMAEGYPEVITAPFLMLEYFQNNNDYYTDYLLASFVRFARLIGVFFSISFPALYVSFVCYHQEMLPTKLMLSITAARDGVPFSTVLELTLLLIVFELLREAGILMQKGVGDALSTVGGVVIGQAAVEARFISAPLIIIVAFTGLTELLAPKMKVAILYSRFFLLFLASVIGLYGYLFGVLLLILRMVSLKSFGIDYTSYMADMEPGNVRDTIFRFPFSKLKARTVRKGEEEYYYKDSQN